jgi:hypothetical protein
MGAEGHPVSFQNITGLPVKPDGIAKLEGISAFINRHFTEHIQHPVVKWKKKEDDCYFSYPIFLASALPNFVIAKRRDDRLSPLSLQQFGAEYGNRLAADQDTIALQAYAKDASP